jgi:ribosome-associated protein
LTATDRAKELAIAAAQAASDKLADDIVAYDVSDVFVITDAFVLASAPNDRQVRAIVDAVEERLLGLGAKPARREGEQEGRWVLLDYIDIVVHVQHAEERTYYSLERLWKDCPVLALPASVTSGRSTGPGPYPAANANVSPNAAVHADAVNGQVAARSDADVAAQSSADPDDDATTPTPDLGGEA